MNFFEFLLEYITNIRSIYCALISTVVVIICAPLVEKFWKKRKKTYRNNSRDQFSGVSGTKKEELTRAMSILVRACFAVVLWIISLIASGAIAYFDELNKIDQQPAEESPKETQLSELQPEITPFPAVGEIVEFGSYRQTKGTNGTWNVDPIKWIVLFQDDEKALLLSLQGLTYKPISSVILKNDTLAWSDSQLYSWLTTEFCGISPDNKEGAFNEEERNIILKNPDGSFAVGLLTKKEAETLLAGSEARVCRPTEYAGYVCENNPESKHGMTPTPDYSGDYWWLCDPGEDYCAYVTVDKSGAIKESGTRYTYCGIMVRPTVWISISEYSRLSG